MRKILIFILIIITLACLSYEFYLKQKTGFPGNNLFQIANAQANPISSHEPIFQTEIPKPLEYSPFKDPEFSSNIIRITNAKNSGFSGIVPDYSKRQAWNSDETLMILKTCDGKTLLYDGTTYKFKKILDGVEGEDIFWNPHDPFAILFHMENALYSVDVRTEKRKKLYTFNGYTFANTRGEGNLSRDGHYYAVLGQVYNEKTGEVEYKDLLVFDIDNLKITAKLALPDKLENFDWVSISPLGNFVVVDYADEENARYHGVEVYDRNFNYKWQKPLGAGHSDLGIDENGDEVLIMDVYNPETNSTFIKKFRLSDGAETSLLEISQLFDLHISCRNEKNPGCCIISTFDYVERLTDDRASWLPFEDEVFALKMDGSSDVQRICHHHSKRYSHEHPDSDNSVYFAEPHATINKNGNRILFGSNWGQNIGQESSIDSYVVEWKR